MTDTEKLKERIQESGLKLGYIAEKLGLTYQGLSNKVSNENEFKASEIRCLKDLLGLSDEDTASIFFAS